MSNHYLQRLGALPLSHRITCATIGAIVLLGMLYPWSPHWGPENFWLSGPLWLLKSKGAVDQMLGTLATAILLPLIIFAAIIPHPWAIAVSAQLPLCCGSLSVRI